MAGLWGLGGWSLIRYWKDKKGMDGIGNFKTPLDFVGVNLVKIVENGI